MNSEILLIVLPVFLVIGLGFCLKRGGMIQDDFLLTLNRLIYYIALPALLFFKISGADFSANFNADLLSGMVVACLVVFALSYIYGIVRGYSPPVLGAFCQASLRGNVAYIGLAMSYNAYGESGFTIAGIMLGFIVPIYNLLSIFALSLPRRRENNGKMPRGLAGEIVLNPLILASAAGITWSYLQLTLPLIIAGTLEIVTGMSLPLALIAVGASFSFRKLQGDVGVIAAALFFKTVLMPILTALFLFYLGVHGQDLAIGILLAGAPTASAAYIQAQHLHGDAELSGAIIMLSTLCSLFTYTAALYLLRLGVG